MHIHWRLAGTCLCSICMLGKSIFYDSRTLEFPFGRCSLPCILALRLPPGDVIPSLHGWGASVCARLRLSAVSGVCLRCPAGMSFGLGHPAWRPAAHIQSLQSHQRWPAFCGRRAATRAAQPTSAHRAGLWTLTRCTLVSRRRLQGTSVAAQKQRCRGAVARRTPALWATMCARRDLHFVRFLLSGVRRVAARAGRPAGPAQRAVDGRATSVARAAQPSPRVMSIL